MNDATHTSSGRQWMWPAIFGFVSFMISHAVLIVTWHEQFRPWFLQSTYGVVTTDAIVLFGAVLAGFSQSQPRIPKSMAFFAGCVAGIIVSIVLVGGTGNLGPIVPFVACMLVVPAVFLGVFVGDFLRARKKKKN